MSTDEGVVLGVANPTKSKQFGRYVMDFLSNISLSTHEENNQDVNDN